MMVVASEGGAKKDAAEKRATETVSRLDSFKEGVDLQVRTVAQTHFPFNSHVLINEYFLSFV